MRTLYWLRGGPRCLFLRVCFDCDGFPWLNSRMSLSLNAGKVVGLAAGGEVPSVTTSSSTQ